MKRIPTLAMAFSTTILVLAGWAFVRFAYDQRWLWAFIELAVVLYNIYLVLFWWRERRDIAAGRPWNMRHQVWKARR